MEKVIEQIEMQATAFSVEKTEIEAENTRLFREQMDMNKQVEDANKIKDEKPEEYKRIIEEVGRKSEIHRANNSKNIRREKDLKNNIINTKKSVIRSLDNKKKLLKEYIDKDVSNVDIEALNKEEERLRNNERLVRVTAEEFSKLSSEQQAVVYQAREDYANISKRLEEIKEIKSFLKMIGNKDPKDVLKNIEDMIKDIKNNFNYENIDKLSHSNSKTKDSRDSKDDKSKNDSKDNKEQKNKQEEPKNDTNNLENKLKNNEKDIEKYKIKMEKYKDDPKKYSAYKACERMVEELEAENEEIRKKLNIKGSDNKNDRAKESEDKDDKTKGKSEKEDETKKTEEKTEKTKETEGRSEKETENKKTEKKNEEEQKDNETLKKQYETNRNKILQYADLLNRYKDDPVMTKNITDEINKLKAENEKIYNEVSNNKNMGNGNTENKLNGNLNKQQVHRIEQKQVSRIEQKDMYRPIIKFDIKTGDYTYIDEKGKAVIYDFFDKAEGNKKQEKVITSKRKKQMIKNAMERGLSKKQAQNMDFRIYILLLKENPQLLANYIDALKGDKNFDKGFDIQYDLRKRGQKIERNIGIIERTRITNTAKKHQKLGIATVFRDKSRAKLYGILAALGVSTIGGATAMLNSGDEQRINSEEKLEKTIDEGIKMNSDISKNAAKIANERNSKESSNEKNSEENFDEKSQEKESISEYVKISQGAMLFRDPTDEIRIMSGKNANEKITIKGTSQDKLYKITKTGYYSPSGKYIAVEEGESLEDALKAKGLDMSFIEDESTVKMCYVVADGIAQWVHEDDIEHVDVRTDKFGNRVDKTDEEKRVDEAYENYMKENSKSADKETQR